MFIDTSQIDLFDSLTSSDVVKMLTMENVVQFLYSLGVEKIDIHEDFLVCPTICHNSLEDAVNMKLYYYDKNKMFHCYTECSENFNIIELYKRYMRLNHYSVTYYEATEYVKSFLVFDTKVDYQPPIEKEHKKNNKNKNIAKLPIYNINSLNSFIHFYHPLWLKDGISEKSMDKFNILFSLGQNKIVIPHYDIEGNLVGIRARAINEEDIAIGKYMPIKIGEQIYKHQLGFNLYGIFQNKEAIKKAKRAIIFESEKSVLLSDTYYNNNSVAVATCGSQLNRFQINLLVKQLGVNEIILAFDKEYINLSDIKCRSYREKLINKCKKYLGLANFYYIFDEHDLLNEKDSPIDKGKEIFETLYARRIQIR